MKNLSSNTQQVSVFQQRIDNISFPEVVDVIKIAIQEKQKCLLYAMNIHILLQLHKNQGFKKKHDKAADIIFADGVPLLWFTHLIGQPLKGRVSGTDLCEKILMLSHEKVLTKVFVIASRESLLKKIKKMYPKTFVGGYVPPFQEHWGKKVNEEIIQQVMKSGANVLFVGVGPLKQERWLIEHFTALQNVYLGIGVGSALEILTGEMPRAPQMMKNFGLEWLWRVLLEPKRLAMRYLHDLFYLIILLFRNVVKK